MVSHTPARFLARAIFSDSNVSGQTNLGFARGQAGAIHKESWSGSPYCLWNEFISAAIGHFIRLPIPAYSFTEFNSRQFFSSIDFNFDRDELPPVLADCCWDSLPDLSTGVVLFDVLIANSDRHDENLVVDRITLPKYMRVFDHDQALLGGGQPPIGEERLTAFKDRLGITGSSITGGNQHCLLPEVKSDKFFQDWIDRIASIPEWYIDDVCRTASNHGMPKAEAKAVKEFLVYRSRRINQLVIGNRAEFKGISKWSLSGQRALDF